MVKPLLEVENYSDIDPLRLIKAVVPDGVMVDMHQPDFFIPYIGKAGDDFIAHFDIIEMIEIGNDPVDLDRFVSRDLL